MGYPSDLKDKKWAVIEHHFQAQNPRGHASKHPRKQIVAAILYVLKTGAQWRQRLSTVADRLRPLQSMEQTRCLGSVPGRLEQTASKKNSARHSPAMGSLIRRASKPNTPATIGALMAAKK